jgi:hypothetical protein
MIGTTNNSTTVPKYTKKIVPRFFQFSNSATKLPIPTTNSFHEKPIVAIPSNIIDHVLDNILNHFGSL